MDDSTRGIKPKHSISRISSDTAILGSSAEKLRAYPPSHAPDRQSSLSVLSVMCTTRKHSEIPLGVYADDRLFFRLLQWNTVRPDHLATLRWNNLSRRKRTEIRVLRRAELRKDLKRRDACLYARSFPLQTEV